jgi:hypothetical protein
MNSGKRDINASLNLANARHLKASGIDAINATGGE